MKSRFHPLALLLLLAWPAGAEVAPVTIRIPEATAWTGQRVPVFVDLRAPGSFAGASAFSLPEIPRTVILKVGSPVVSSEDIGGKSWFVQTHEFALFSQQDGTVEIPSFPVRFSSREGFTGPATEQELMVPPAKVEIRRPPGTESIGFLVTTSSLVLEESWDPVPEPCEAGTVFKRTIVQRTSQMTGMALSPAPTNAIPGVRIYPGPPEVLDKTERGTFTGERRETVTYLMQDPGTVELPAITYSWWNPEEEQLQSKTLPAVTIAVTPAPGNASAPAGKDSRTTTWPWLFAVAALATLAVWQRKSLAQLLARCWRTLNPPERRAARQLLAACQANDPNAAQMAWNCWRLTRDRPFHSDPRLHAAVLGMQRHLFGPPTDTAWRGEDLAKALAAHRADARPSTHHHERSALPPLNSR